MRPKPWPAHRGTQAESGRPGQVKSGRAKRAVGRGWCPHLCGPRGPRHAGDRRANETNARPPTRAEARTPGPGRPSSAAHGTGIPGARTHGRDAARSQVKSSQVVFKNTGFFSVHKHWGACHAAYRAVTRHTAWAMRARERECGYMRARRAGARASLRARGRTGWQSKSSHQEGRVSIGYQRR